MVQLEVKLPALYPSREEISSFTEAAIPQNQSQISNSILQLTAQD